MQFNKQGRTVSDSMRLKAFTDWLKTQKKPQALRQVSYRGFTLSSGRREWSITSDSGKLWQIGFTSEAKAREAVDRCLEIRSELEIQRANDNQPNRAFICI